MLIQQPKLKKRFELTYFLSKENLGCLLFASWRKGMELTWVQATRIIRQVPEYIAQKTACYYFERS